MSIKSNYNLAKYKRSVKQVNQAVDTLSSKYGLAYSITHGIIGDTSTLSKNDMKAVNRSANVMRKSGAGYYNKRQKFDESTAISPNRYVPLGLSDHVEVQKSAYEQACSSMHLRAPIKFIQRTLYDTRLQSHPNRRVLGLTAENAQEWAALAESLWRDDKESKSWDDAEQNNYSQIADQALYKYLAVGEFFAVRRSYSNEPERLANMSLQLISPFQISSPLFSTNYNISYYDYSCKGLIEINAAEYHADLKPGHYIETGIEYDSKNREIAIYVAPSKYGEPWQKIDVYNKNGFQQVLHGFIQSEEGQKRGIPESAYSYHEYVMAEDLEKFEMESARLNTIIAGAETTDSNGAPDAPSSMDDVGKATGYFSENTDWGDTPPAGTTPPSFTTRAVESGGFILQKMAPGQKYTELKTDRPNINIPAFLDKIFEFLYPANFGLSIVTVKQRFDGSYNASKGAIDLSWKNGIEYHLKQFTSDFHKPNFIAWLNGKIATGRISAPKWEIPEFRNAWASMTIITPAKPSLNPAAESTATKNRLESGTSNRELESQTLTGTSFNENVERLTAENIKLASANAILNPAPVETEKPENDKKGNEK